jgi:uncharacterized protein YegL
MKKNNFENGPESRSSIPSMNGASGNDDTAAYLASLDAVLHSWAGKVGPDTLQSLGATITAIVGSDSQAGAGLLEELPDILSRLLPLGEGALQEVLSMTDSVLPYGAGLAARFMALAPSLAGGTDKDALAKTGALACSLARIDQPAAEGIITHAPFVTGKAGFEALRRIASVAALIASYSRTYALRTVEEAPGIIEALIGAGAEPGLVADIYGLALVIARSDWNSAVEAMRDSPAIVRKLLAHGSDSFPSEMYRRAHDAAAISGRFALAFLHTAGEITGELGDQGAQVLWECAFCVAKVSPDEAASLLGASLQTIQGLKEILPAGQELDVYRIALELCRSHAGLARKYLKASVRVAKKTALEDLEKIAAMAADIAAVSNAAASSFLEATPGLMEKTGMEGLAKINREALRIAGINGEAASRLLMKSQTIIERADVDVLKTVGDFTALVAAESLSAALKLIDKCPSVVEGLWKAGGEPLVARVCRLGEKILQYNARIAVSFVEQSPHIIRLVGFDGLEKLQELALQAGRASWTAAVALLSGAARLIERIGFDGLELIAKLAGLIAVQNSYGAVSMLEKSPDIIDRILAHGDRDLVFCVYEQAAGIAGSDWMLASTIMEESPALLAKTGSEGFCQLLDLTGRAAGVNTTMAKHLVEAAPAIIARTGFEGLETLLSCAAAIAAKDAGAALGVVDRSAALIDRLDQGGYTDISSSVYGLVAGVAATSTAVAVRLLEKSPELIEWAGPEGFGLIVSFIWDAAKDDEEKALSYLSGESTTFSDFMDNIPKGMELKTIKPVLSTYLRALLGRRVEIDEAKTVYTDGRKIYLPGRIRDFQDNQDNFRMYKVAATHQEAHLEYGSYEFDLSKIVDLVNDLRERYGLTIQEDKSDMDKFAGLFPEAALAQDLFNLMEDFRIETILKKEYPALGDDIGEVNRHTMRKRRPPEKIINPKQRTVEMIVQNLQAGTVFGDPEDPAVAVMQRALPETRLLEEPDSDVHDSAAVAAKIYFLIEQAFSEPYRTVRPSSRPLDQDMVSQNIGNFGTTSQNIHNRLQGRTAPAGSRRGPRVETQSDGQGDSQPAQTSPASESVAQKMQPAGRLQKSFRAPSGGGRPEAAQRGEDSEEAVAASPAREYNSTEKIERLLKALYRERGVTPKEIERHLESMTQNDAYMFMRSLEASLDKKTELESERGTSLYHEWGEDLLDYRHNWARVREQTHNAASLSFYKESVGRHSGLLKKIRREFQMLKPEGFTRLKRQYDGDDIDLDAVVDFIADRRAGISPSEKNYTLIQKRQRDIAVGFLIDMSRSTRGETIRQEKEALIIMSEALHEVGDAFAIYGFSGNNRDNVDFYRIKDFDDAYDERVKKRISAIEDRFENRDGAAIRHTIGKLRRRPERTKLMILLSDGKPVDKEYSGAYAIEDTRMALKEAQHFGIRTFCITVDKSAPEYLPRMYSHSSWTVIDDVARLPEKITRIYRMLTA